MPHKLLLADDSVTIQRVIELTFADEDVQVAVVGDGQQAIERIQADRPDIVLADIGMPERDGYEVAAFIKSDAAARAHSGRPADRRVRAARRGPRARGRLRRRAGQAVRAADGDQPGARSCSRAGVRRSRPAAPPAPRRRHAPAEIDARSRRRPTSCRSPRRPTATRSRTTSIGSTRRSPISAPRRRSRRLEPDEICRGRLTSFHQPPPERDAREPGSADRLGSGARRPLRAGAPAASGQRLRGAAGGRAGDVAPQPAAIGRRRRGASPTTRSRKSSARVIARMADESCGETVIETRRTARARRDRPDQARRRATISADRAAADPIGSELCLTVRTLPTPISVPDKPALEGLEAKWTPRWEESGVYRFDRSQPRADVFAIDTPPPTVSGSLHVGHVFSYTHTDVVARFQRMRGRAVFYPDGVGRQRAADRTPGAELLRRPLRAVAAVRPGVQRRRRSRANSRCRSRGRTSSSCARG